MPARTGAPGHPPAKGIHGMLRASVEAGRAERPPPVPLRRPRGPRSPWHQGAAPYLYVAPFFVVFGVFGLFPLVYTGVVSLHRVDFLNPERMAWVGLANYAALWRNSQFHNALLNTFTLAVLSTVPQLLAALGLAQLLNLSLRGRTLLRVAILLPYATSVAAASLVFAQLFGRDHGLVNWALTAVGLQAVDWEPGRWTSQIAISTIIIWRWTGYNALIYLAGMQTIPGELYEAAALDGAGRWAQFRHVTLPSLRPTIFLTVVISSIFSLQIFGEPRLFAGNVPVGIQGGASNQYQTLAMLLYQQGWSFLKLGQAAATAWSMFLIILVVTTVNGLLARGGMGRRRAGEEGR